MPVSPENPAPVALFYVDVNGRRRGPFGKEFIEAMIMAGQFPKTVSVCREGSSEWMPLAPPVLPRPAVQPSPPKPIGSFMGKVAALAALLGVGAFVFAALRDGNSNSGKLTNPKSASRYTPSSSKAKTRYEPTKLSSFEIPLLPSNIQLSPETLLPSPTVIPPPAPSSRYTPSSLAEEPTFSITSRTGRTYRVSRSDQIRLSKWQSTLDISASAVESARSRLSASMTQVDNAKSRLRSAKAQLENLGATLNNYNQWEVDNYNAKVDAYNAQRERFNAQVDTHNAQNAQFNAQVDTHNAEVDKYNADLVRVGTPIF